MAATRPDSRRRGNIEERNGALRVRLYSGIDPVTGKQVYLRATIHGTDEAAWKKADNKLAEFRTQVLHQRSVSSSVTFGYALDEWMRVSEIEDSTRKTYDGYIERTIRPAIGDLAVKKLDARTLESFYTALRRCRTRCDGTPFIEKHKAVGEHDCAAKECRVHKCKPMAASTVRQIHAIISGTLGAAERWNWISSNPARIARRPKQKPPEPDPPTSAEAAKLAEEAFRMDDDWGTLVWLVMTTGMRRGELVGLRFSCIDFDAEVIDLRRNWVGGKKRTPRPTRTAGSPSIRRLSSCSRNSATESPRACANSAVSSSVICLSSVGPGRQTTLSLTHLML